MERIEKEVPMSPFIVAVVVFLTFLFIVLSVVPLLNGKHKVDSSHHPSTPKTRGAH
jgi:hypothetical protein